MDKNNSLEIIYILGTGHSGSTLLELILSTSHNAFSVGGFRYLDKYIRADIGVEYDDQGDKPIDSPMWTTFAENKNEYILDNATEPVLSFKNRMSILFFGKPAIVPHRYRNKALYSEVQKQATNIFDKKVEVVIDSSKTLARLIEVRERSNSDVFVIHLIRDVRGVVNSNRKLGKSIFASAKYWLTDNLYAVSYLRKSVPKERQIRIHYEDFVQKPEYYVDMLNKHSTVHIDKDTLVQNINQQKSYRFAGNAMRKKEFTGIKKDEKWRDELPRIYQILFAPLNLFFK